MPAVGDLRNRLMALADLTVRGNPEIYALFAFRFPTEGPEALRARLDAMVRGSDALVTAVPDPPLGTVLSHLAVFAGAMPEDFDLRGASVGNLVITGGYLDRGRDLDSALDLFSDLVAARGTVRPVIDGDLHLVAVLRDGRRVVGQHRITGRREPPLEVPVERVHLCMAGSEETVLPPRIDGGVADMIGRADLVCFPIGSFYSSLLATLLPRGVADSVARSGAPKIYVPNPDGTDPEEIGLDLPAKVRRLLACLKEGATAEVTVRDLLHIVLLDTRAGSVPGILLDEVRSQGVDVVDVPLVSADSAPLYDERLLAEALLSLA
jgi:CofD-related protein of GAK system